MIIPTKKLGILVLLITLGSAAIAQDDSGTEKKKGRPNLPGTFQIDLGFNLPSEKARFSTGFLGSSTVNVYYFHDMRLWKSKFSLHPGIGLGLERYKFNNGRTLAYSSDRDSVTMQTPDVPNVRKSKLITNYLDIPVEIRWNSNPDDPNKSLKVSLGFKFGVLYDSFTKLNYREDGEKKKLKDKQNWNLNPIRYGPYLRIGGGTVSAYAYYSLSPIFKSGKGPGGKDINNFTVGISVAAF